MKIQIWSVGKENEDYIQDGVQNFSSRINHYCDFKFKIIPSIPNGSKYSIPELKKKEGISILQLLNPQDYLVALDENAKELNTLQLASFMEIKTSSGLKNLIFLIGGSYGLDQAILKRAQDKLSLSQLTFPHQLVRLILTEQIFRVFTILNHEKYHHQ